MRLEREVTGLEEANDGVRHVPLEGQRTRRQEERIVPAPHRQKARLMGPEIALKSRIERNIALVIAEQIELHLIGARTREIEIVERPAIRGYRGRVGDTVGVLPMGRFGL